MTIEKLQTPVGRIVWGNPAVPQKKTDQNTRQPILKDGQPIMQWAFGVAFAKADFAAHIWPAMDAEIKTGYPNGPPGNFSFKYKDGDGVDSKGVPYSKREGYAGCYILNVSTEAFAPPIFKWNGRSYDQIDANGIKTGDFVALNLNMKLNIPTNRTHTPGLYVNPNGIELVGYGTEIVTVNADPMALFGGQQRALPPGASATPISSAPAGVGMPGMTPAMQPMQQPGPMQQSYQPAPVQQYQPQQPQMQPAPVYQQPQQLPPPAHDFVQNAGNPMPGNGMPYPSNNGPTAMTGAYPSNPAPMQQPYQPMQPAPGGMPQQPGQMPGMMPGR